MIPARCKIMKLTASQIIYSEESYFVNKKIMQQNEIMGNRLNYCNGYFLVTSG